MTALVDLPEVDITVNNKDHFNMIHLTCLHDNSTSVSVCLSVCVCACLSVCL